MSQLHADRDVCKGSTDAPQKATLKMKEALEPIIVDWEHVRLLSD
jgi:hypothetical protein